MKNAIFALFVSISLALTGCGGGGGGSGDSPVPLGAKVSISPAQASTVPGQVIQINIAGGKGPYRLTSSDPSILPIPDGQSTIENLYSATVNLKANDVDSTRTATLTVYDSTGTSATAAIEVRYTALAIAPAQLSLGSGIAQDYHIFGGMPPYTVTVTRPDILAASPIANKSFTVTARQTLNQIDNLAVTVTDNAGNNASSTVSVFPITVFSTITVDPIMEAGSTADALKSANAIRSGSRGLATIQLSDAYIGKRALTITRISGDFVFDGEAAGVVSTTTGETGSIAIPLTVASGTATQYGRFRVTDDITGNFQEVTFSIAGITLAALPDKINISCAAPQPASIVVFGGNPPYALTSSSPGAVTVNPATIAADGGVANLVPGATCASANATILIRDAVGATATVTYTAN